MGGGGREGCSYYDVVAENVIQIPKSTYVKTTIETF